MYFQWCYESTATNGPVAAGAAKTPRTNPFPPQLGSVFSVALAHARFGHSAMCSGPLAAGSFNSTWNVKVTAPSTAPSAGVRIISLDVAVTFDTYSNLCGLLLKDEGLLARIFTTVPVIGDPPSSRMTTFSCCPRLTSR